ncbi:hypothetical protein C8J45_11315 [Sphingomonas sp. PP-CE-3G-477]|uniref:hypothetical protein n=1 Tax=Sphingomonas sp. PP-CE-3G-477 TaxID=2135660 RepID=UPI000D38AB3C|nr:hypothetical protein [Sphingomonas sp. PP-CE-3G-477]PTQ60064.1 hypothetical protein C8J45_11315 [Sphingomonas sp. PP-CE-3G-477]
MSAPVSFVVQNDVVLRVIGGTWAIDATYGWRVAIRNGVEQWHGNAMDWPHVRRVVEANNAECCSTGGSYVEQLPLDRRTMRAASVGYSHGARPFP